jgi:hypothetical protein
MCRVAVGVIPRTPGTGRGRVWVAPEAPWRAFHRTIEYITFPQAGKGFVPSGIVLSRPLRTRTEPPRGPGADAAGGRLPPRPSPGSAPPRGFPRPRPPRASFRRAPSRSPEPPSGWPGKYFARDDFFRHSRIPRKYRRYCHYRTGVTGSPAGRLRLRLRNRRECRKPGKPAGAAQFRAPAPPGRLRGTVFGSARLPAGAGPPPGARPPRPAVPAGGLRPSGPPVPGGRLSRPVPPEAGPPRQAPSGPRPRAFRG